MQNECAWRAEDNTCGNKECARDVCTLHLKGHPLWWCNWYHEPNKFF